MQALLLIDVQNEFSAKGQRAVADFTAVLDVIRAHIAAARRTRRPIAWVRHHNKPHESRAFVPGTWGAQFADGIAPSADYGPERVFEKDVYGAFSGTDIESWLRGLGVERVLCAGFYAHMCVSTSAREALIRGFDVLVDPDATGARAIDDPLLGTQSADEVRRTALLQVCNMGARVVSRSELERERTNA